jgi:predicted RNase H-like HicB family nuclease
MSRKWLATKLMTRAAYEVTYERDSNDRWFVHCPNVPGAHSHGRTLASARFNIREAIALVLDIRDEAGFDLVETIHLPDAELRAALDTARNLRQRAIDVDEKASKATLEAVAASVSSEDSLGVRDIADLLGISHQRVQQLASGVRRND